MMIALTWFGKFIAPVLLGMWLARWLRRRRPSRDVVMLDLARRQPVICRTHLHLWPLLAMMTREAACAASFGGGVLAGLLLACVGLLLVLASTLRGNTPRRTKSNPHTGGKRR